MTTEHETPDPAPGSWVVDVGADVVPGLGPATYSPRQARACLAENEDETAMTPERLAALEAARADGEPAGGPDLPVRSGLDEAQSPVTGRRFTRA